MPQLPTSEMSGQKEECTTLSTVDVYELASVIGSQFEKLIDSYGPESVTNLMPTVIRVLEHLEELAKFSESERAETVELKFTIERLLAEKKLKAEERVKYEKVICLFCLKYSVHRGKYYVDASGTAAAASICIVFTTRCAMLPVIHWRYGCRISTLAETHLP